MSCAGWPPRTCCGWRPGVWLAAWAASTSVPRAHARLLGDPSGRGWQTAGLTGRRVQPDIGDQLVGGLEAREVADGGHDGDRDGHVDPRDGHQPSGVDIVESEAGQLGIDQFQLAASEVQLPQQRPHRAPLIGGQLLVVQPSPALGPEQVSERAARQQVAGQDGLHLVLHPGPLAHQRQVLTDLAAQRFGRLVGLPHRRQIVSRQQLKQYNRRRRRHSLPRPSAHKRRKAQ